MRRGRRSPDELRPGDALDFWRVEAVEPDRLRAPARRDEDARARPGCSSRPQPRAGGGTLLIQTAFFQPHGLAGLAYWYGLYPVHQADLLGPGGGHRAARRVDPAMKLGSTRPCGQSSWHVYK